MGTLWGLCGVFVGTLWRICGRFAVVLGRLCGGIVGTWEKFRSTLRGRCVDFVRNLYRLWRICWEEGGVWRVEGEGMEGGFWRDLVWTLYGLRDDYTEGLWGLCGDFAGTWEEVWQDLVESLRGLRGDFVETFVGIVSGLCTDFVGFLWWFYGSFGGNLGDCMLMLGTLCGDFVESLWDFVGLCESFLETLWELCGNIGGLWGEKERRGGRLCGGALGLWGTFWDFWVTLWRLRGDFGGTAWVLCGTLRRFYGDFVGFRGDSVGRFVRILWGLCTDFAVSLRGF